MAARKYLLAVAGACLVWIFGTACAAGERILFSPDRVKEGEWVLFEVPGVGLKSKKTVVSVSGTGEDAVITILSEAEMDGIKMKGDVYKCTRAEMRQHVENVSGSTDKTETVKVTVKGKEIEAEKRTWIRGNNVNYTYWSDDIPVNGVIKYAVRKGDEEKVSMELVDYGGR